MSDMDEENAAGHGQGGRLGSPVQPATAGEMISGPHLEGQPPPGGLV